MSAPQQTTANAVDVAQASELTGLSQKALRRRLERGTLDSIKVGGKRLIPISELENRDLLGGAADKDALPAPAAAPPAREPEPRPAEPPRSESPEPEAGGGSGREAATAEPAAPPNGVEPSSPPRADRAPAVSTESPPREPAAPPASARLIPADHQPPSDPVVPVSEPAPFPPPAPQPSSTLAAEPATATTAQFARPEAARPGAPLVDAPGYTPGQYAPGQPPPPYGYPPDRGAWHLWYQYRALRWLVVLLILALIGLLIWLLAFRSDGESGTVQPGGGPVGVTEQDLIALSQRLHQPIYWAGDMPATHMELTETNNSYAYIRYLSDDTSVGDSSAGFLTVGTYPSSNAFRNLNAYARNSRAKTQRIQNGGVAVVIPGSPTSVYFAYPHEDVQVEVYDPQPQRALDLVKSGVIRPVIASTASVGTAGTATVPTTTPSPPSELPTIPQG